MTIGLDHKLVFLHLLPRDSILIKNIMQTYYSYINMLYVLLFNITVCAARVFPLVSCYKGLNFMKVNKRNIRSPYLSVAPH
jgi:hypothetical protein